MNFLKKVAEKNFDDSVHLQFMRFSRGEFTNRASIKARHSKGVYTINTTAEFANELVREVAEKVGDRKVHVTGAIVSTQNLKENLEFYDLLAHAETKQFAGVRTFIITAEMTGKEILNFMNKNPKLFFALTFATPDGDYILKVKPKAPKSAKPPTKGGDDEIKADFCKLITNDEKLGKSFVFEKPDFKTAEINHVYKIDEIVIPAELKNEKDFAKVREMARRKGKIIRMANIDGKEVKSELEFEA